MTTSLSNITVKDSSHSLVIKSNDITIDGTSILGQNNFADRDLSNLSTTGQNILDSKLDTTQITNCITEIPQDIKLEIDSNGKCWLKADSKVYVPNGFEANGTTLKFDKVVIESDLYINSTGGNGKGMICVNAARSSSTSSTLSCVSGDGVTPVNYGMCYDTSTNIIQRWGNGTVTVDKASFPLAIVTLTNGAITSIDQVFNGFGYIGSTVFALPGVKGLIPNGRNADGTLKNTEFTTTTVSTHIQTGQQSKASIYLSSSTLFPSDYRTYDEINNVILNSSGQKENICCIGSLTREVSNPYNITSFTPKTAFHAVDYNNFKQADDNNVKLTGNQTIGGIKTFADNVFIENAGSRYITKNTSMTRGTYNSSQSESKIVNQDRNGKLLSEIRTYVESSDSATSLYLGAITEDSSGNQLYKTVFRGTARKDGTSVVSLEGVSAVYAPTPATSDNSSKIATTNWVADPAKSTNVVHRNGNETINDTKTFTGDVIFSKSGNFTGYRIRNTNYSYLTNPATGQNQYIIWGDKNNHDLSYIQQEVNTSGTVNFNFVASNYKADGTRVVNFLNVAVHRDGTTSTYAPTPPTSDNSTNIATTAYCNNKHQVVSVLPANPDANVFYYIPA